MQTRQLFQSTGAIRQRLRALLRKKALARGPGGSERSDFGALAGSHYAYLENVFHPRLVLSCGSPRAWICQCSLVNVRFASAENVVLAARSIVGNQSALSRDQCRGDLRRMTRLRNAEDAYAYSRNNGANGTLAIFRPTRVCRTYTGST